MKRTAFIIMILTVLSKIFGFVREIVLSYFYGASNISDIYLISLTIPGVIFSFIATGVVTGFIPMYTKIYEDRGENEANIFTSNLYNILILITTVLVALAMIFTEPIVKIFALGFEKDILNLTIKFTRITLVGMYCTGFVAIYSGLLQVKGNYIIPAIVGLPLNFFYILAIALSYYQNIILLPIITVVAMLSQVILLLPFIKKEDYRHSLKIKIFDSNIINMIYIMIPVIIGTSVNQINILVDRTLASKIIEGGISALNYANRINLFVQGIFVLSIITVIYPIMSKRIAENNTNGFIKSLKESINVINILVIPASVGSILFSRPIVEILFGRGAFDSNAVLLTTNAFRFYSLGMIGYALREVLSRAFYSMKDTKTTMVNASLGVILNIVLNIILSRYLGLGGLALATSIAALFTTCLLFISLHKKIGPFGMKQISISFLKILFSSLVMGFIAKLCFAYLNSYTSQNMSLIISIVIGVISYFGTIYFMKIEDVDEITSLIKLKIKGSV